MKKHIPTVGLLIGGIADAFAIQTCNGVMKAAKEHGIHVVILPGKYLNRDLSSNRELMYEYQYNTLFSYSLNQRLDGVLITAENICCFSTQEQKEAFLKNFKNIPTVLIGGQMKEFPCASYDNSYGIIEGLNYLIEKLRCKKIVMFGGPDSNTDAQERKTAYIETLEKHHIPFDEDNYLAGNFTNTQAQRLGEYLDTHKDIDAIFCANDDTAMSLYQAMYSRNLIPGKDIYVMGYDNTVEGEKAKPALSSVNADASALGESALKLLVSVMANGTAENVSLPTNFIKRESCGAISNKSTNIVHRLKTESIDVYYNEIFYRHINKSNTEEIHQIFRSILTLIIDFYENDFHPTNEHESLIELFDRFLSLDGAKYADTIRLSSFIDGVCNTLVSKYKNTQYTNIIYSLQSSIYQKLLLVEEQLQGELLKNSETKDYDLKTYVSSIAQFDKGSDYGYGTLLDNLDWLDIQNAKLYIFNKPITHLFEEDFQVPTDLYLKASLDNGQATLVSAKKQKIKSADIFRSNFSKDDNSAKVLLPIFNNVLIYGVLLCNISNQIHVNGEFLASQLGVSAKILNLLKENENIQMKYEENIRILQENNISLDTISKTDSLTGAWNRRGFTLESKKLMQSNTLQKKDTLVAYIDMNNLKIINDRYGHDEGDFSINLINDLLSNEFPDGVIGRLGGDEFALVCAYDQEDNGKSVVKNIYNRFTAYNTSSKKRYNVTVSVGTYVIPYGRSIELQEALTLADEKMYLEKLQRTKKVAKDPEYSTEFTA